MFIQSTKHFFLKRANFKYLFHSYFLNNVTFVYQTKSGQLRGFKVK